MNDKTMPHHRHVNRVPQYTITRAHRCDLNAFQRYLAKNGVNLPEKTMLATHLAAWQLVTSDHVELFAHHCLKKGMAINSVNQRLSTIRKYARLSEQFGHIATIHLAKIESIKGFKQTDQQVPTKHTIERLRQQPDTPQGRRDRVLLDLLLEQDLRTSDIETLQVNEVDLQSGELTVWRTETGAQQCCKLKPRTLQSLKAYFTKGDAPICGALLRRSSRNGSLMDGGMSCRAIHKRIKTLSSRSGIGRLSPKDLQMYHRAVRLV